MSIPNYLEDVKAAKVKYADAWTHAHVEGDPRKHEWITLFAADMHAKDSRVAMNGKRGNPSDLSMDALNILCTSAESSGRTPEGLPCVVVDVIGGAGGPNPQPTWTVFTNAAEGSGAHVIPGAVPQPPIPPQPQPPVGFPYPDEPTAVLAFQTRLKASYNAVGRKFPDEQDADAFRHFTRYGYSCRGMAEPDAANKHIKELRAELGAPPE